uniref:Uncharacterized protein n=1 Tax=Arundo donax TaxID=35708 RepID=A0A0A9G6E9_ARUDO
MLRSYTRAWRGCTEAGGGVGLDGGEAVGGGGHARLAGWQPPVNSELRPSTREIDDAEGHGRRRLLPPDLGIRCFPRQTERTDRCTRRWGTWWHGWLVEWACSSGSRARRRMPKRAEEWEKRGLG